jgi:hypothetical protein
VSHKNPIYTSATLVVPGLYPIYSALLIHIVVYRIQFIEVLDPQQDVHLQVRSYPTPLSSDSEPNNLCLYHQSQSFKLVFANEIVDAVNFANYSLPIHVQLQPHVLILGVQCWLVREAMVIVVISGSRKLNTSRCLVGCRPASMQTVQLDWRTIFGSRVDQG